MAVIHASKVRKWERGHVPFDIRIEQRPCCSASRSPVASNNAFTTSTFSSDIAAQYLVLSLERPCQPRVFEVDHLIGGKTSNTSRKPA
jgi:hypothetical protein